MNARVQSSEPVIVLELSVGELVALQAVERYQGGDPSGVRGAIEEGLDAALELVPEPFQSQARAALDTVTSSGIGYVYARVDEALAERGLA